MDRGAWCVRVGVVVKSWTRLNDFHFFSGQFVPLIFLTCLSTFYFLSVQVSSVVQSYSILCNLMDCSTPGFPVHCQLLEFTQTHVHRVGNGDLGSIPGLGRSPGGGHSNPRQYSTLENPHRQRSLVAKRTQHKENTVLYKNKVNKMSIGSYISYGQFCHHGMTPSGVQIGGSKDPFLGFN